MGAAFGRDSKLQDASWPCRGGTPLRRHMLLFSRFQVRFNVHGAPDWIRVDADTGVIEGTPPAGAVGQCRFLVYAEIPKVGCLSQQIDLTVNGTPQD